MARVSDHLLAALDQLRERFQVGYLESDPLRYVHRYRDREDQEVVAFLASGLAFGRVASIFASLDVLLPKLTPSPAAAARAAALGDLPDLRGFRHRWIDGETMGGVLVALGALLTRYGSLEQAFLAHDSGDGSLKDALHGVIEEALATAPAPSRGLRFFFASPKGGSACKRQHLFLRWMIRANDGVDLGLWPHFAPSRLLMPVDTHVAFLGKALGLTTLRTASWAMAEELTSAFLGVAPNDPVRYDWPLSRLGILGDCPKRRSTRHCPMCPIYRDCRL